MKLAAARAQCRSSHEKIAASAVRGNLHKLTDDLAQAWDHGKFESRCHLFDFIADLTRSVVLADDDAGKCSKNMRWHESTHRIFQALTKLGGPRAQRFVAANVDSPHLRTIQRKWSVENHVQSSVVSLVSSAFPILQLFSSVRNRGTHTQRDARAQLVWIHSRARARVVGPQRLYVWWHECGVCQRDIGRKRRTHTRARATLVKCAGRLFVGRWSSLVSEGKRL